MNRVFLIGRLTKDPEVRKSQKGMTITRYTLAVDRRGKKDEADFISCVVFDKGAEFAEKYFRKGMKVAVTGRIQTGSFEKDGKKVYTTDVILDDQEFAESKSGEKTTKPEEDDGYVDIPDDLDLPWG